MSGSSPKAEETTPPPQLMDREDVSLLSAIAQSPTSSRPVRSTVARSSSSKSSQRKGRSPDEYTSPRRGSDSALTSALSRAERAEAKLAVSEVELAKALEHQRQANIQNHEEATIYRNQLDQIISQ